MSVAPGSRPILYVMATHMELAGGGDFSNLYKYNQTIIKSLLKNSTTDMNEAKGKPKCRTMHVRMK